MTKMNNQPAKICVAVAAQSVKKALKIAATAADQTDIIEIRLDTLTDPGILPFVTTISTPLLFTNRASWEGGHFSGTEESRLEFLHKAIELKAAYVDIELNTTDELLEDLIKSAKNSDNTKTIISWHNFETTPSSQALQTILQRQYRSGASIGKIVTMANNYDDVLRVLNLQTTATEINFPLIAFCMGPIGVISRVATWSLGGAITYASPDSAKGTAPGQLPVSSLNTIINELKNAV